MSFGLDKSTNLGLLGPNGAGKSTIVNCLLNQTKKTSGNIIYNNKKIKQSFSEMIFKESQNIYYQQSFGIVN